MTTSLITFTSDATASTPIRLVRYRAGAFVTKYVAGLGAAKAELSGPKAGEYCKQIVAQAFPDCRLPYMIDFGVHGLVNQVAAR